MQEEIRPPLTPAEAWAEADRCLECGTTHAPAPCAVACPADIDVPTFIAEIAAGDPDEAARTIFAENILGGTCSRVCPVEVLCEGACALDPEGRKPIEIGALQRYATDHALAAGVRPRRAHTTRHAGGRVIVIGAGPSGLACAGELAILGHVVVVHDAHGEVGGLVRYGIAPFREQRDPLPQEAAMLESMGVEFRLNHPITGPADIADLEREADAIFLGIGLGGDIHVSYPGEPLDGVHDSLPYIEAIKTGHPAHVGETVVTIGGGNTAMDVAREALRLGATESIVLYRRDEQSMPAYHHEVEEALEEGVRFEFLVNPIRLMGERRVEAIECQRMRLAEPDESGRRRPEPVPGSEFTMEADTVIKALGQQPRSELVSWIDGVNLDYSGRVVLDPDTGRTENPKYFSAGDAVSGGATVVQAVRGGKIAAKAIHRQLLRERGAR
jgi:glutamate synthase (NADPH/NADH) small chain